MTLATLQSLWMSQSDRPSCQFLSQSSQWPWRWMHSQPLSDNCMELQFGHKRHFKQKRLCMLLPHSQFPVQGLDSVCLWQTICKVQFCSRELLAFSLTRYHLLLKITRRLLTKGSSILKHFPTFHPYFILKYVQPPAYMQIFFNVLFMKWNCINIQTYIPLGWSKVMGWGEFCSLPQDLRTKRLSLSLVD